MSNYYKKLLGSVIILIGLLTFLILFFGSYSVPDAPRIMRPTISNNRIPEDTSQYQNTTSITDPNRAEKASYIKQDSGFRHFYCNREPGQASTLYGFDAYCYVVVRGDTLWEIARKYYGDPYLWKQLRLYNDEFDITPDSPNDPRFLIPGTKLVLWMGIQVFNEKRTAGGTTSGWGIDIETGDLYTTAHQNNNAIIYVNNDIYDQFPGRLKNFFIDERTNNKIYVILKGGNFVTGGTYQFVFNKVRNPFVGGYSFELLTFSPDSKLYAVRNNVKDNVVNPQFKVLSNIGNGPIYDFVDSLIWYDNKTLVYRAQNSDRWRIVVNNADYQTYNFLENLRLEDGVIKFDARHDDGSWTKEQLIL